MDELSLLQETHQLTVESKVELERTVENLRQQLRSVGAQYSACKRHVQVVCATNASQRDTSTPARVSTIQRVYSRTRRRLTPIRVRHTDINRPPSQHERCYPHRNPFRQVAQTESAQLRAFAEGKSPPQPQAAAVQQAVNTQAVAEARAMAAEATTETLEEVPPRPVALAAECQRSTAQHSAA